MHELVQRQHAGNKAFDSEDEYSDDNNQDIDEPKGHKSWNRMRTLSNSSDNEVDNDTTHNGDPTKPNSRPETPADTKLLDDDANFGLQQNANFGKTSPDHNDLPPPVITHDTDFVEELPALYDAEAPMPSVSARYAQQ